MNDPEFPAPDLAVRTTRIDHVSPLLSAVDARSPLVFVRRQRGHRRHRRGRCGSTFTGPDPHGRRRSRLAGPRRARDRRRRGPACRAVGWSPSVRSPSTTSPPPRACSSCPRIVVGRRDGVAGSRASTGPSCPTATRLGASVPSAVDAGASRRRAPTPTRSPRRSRRSRPARSARSCSRAPSWAACRPRRTSASSPRTLPGGYPDCYTFAVDGLIGASPETLVKTERGVVSARVLAGSAARGVDAVTDEQAALALATSAKDLDEHAFALRSLLLSLGPHATDIVTGEQPFTLKLPNLWHLASDVRGRLTDGSSSLDLIASLHPTAAVAGTPTPAALAAHPPTRTVRPGPIRGAGRLGRRRRRRRVGDRPALRPRGRRRHGPGLTPAPASSPSPCPSARPPRRA